MPLDRVWSAWTRDLMVFFVVAFAAGYLFYRLALWWTRRRVP
ncbi:MAG TPA: hypothetical protein VIL95_01675 [Bacillota bacterium]